MNCADFYEKCKGVDHSSDVNPAASRNREL
jgi:hypothetical protein